MEPLYDIRPLATNDEATRERVKGSDLNSPASASSTDSRILTDPTFARSPSPDNMPLLDRG